MPLWLTILIAIMSAALLAWAAARFYLARQRPRPVSKPLPEPVKSAEEKYALPALYGTDEIVALPKDPEWLYAYWEATAAKQTEFSDQFGPGAWENSQPVIRIYDLTGSLNPEIAPYEDVAINETATSWYLHYGKPDHTVVLDLGRRLPDGRFVTLARSNTVTMPANAPSPVIDPDWPPLEAAWPENPGEQAEKQRSAGTSPPGWPFGISSPQIAERRNK